MILDGILSRMAAKYGKPSDLLKDELCAYILDELAHDTPEEREAIYKAISRTCKMSEGYPDVASVRAAVWRWAQDGMGDLARRIPTAREYDPDFVPSYAAGEHVLDYKQLAERDGIDTSKDGWLVRYMMGQIEAKAGA